MFRGCFNRSRVHQNKLRVSRPRPKRPRLNRFFCGDEIAGDPVRLTLQSPRVPSGHIHSPLSILYFGAGASQILEKTKADLGRVKKSRCASPTAPPLYQFIPFHKFLGTQSNYFLHSPLHDLSILSHLPVVNHFTEYSPRSGERNTLRKSSTLDNSYVVWNSLKYHGISNHIFSAEER